MVEEQGAAAPVALISAGGEQAPGMLTAALLAAGDRIITRPGQIMVAAGTRTDDVYIMVSGMVRVTVFSAEGREVVIRDHGPGGFFGELAAIDRRRRSANIVGLKQSQLVVLRGDEFRNVVFATPEHSGWFAAHLAAMVRDLTNRTIELSTLSFRSRLYRLIIRLSEASGVVENRAKLDPCPTHEVLATMIGSTREAVTRELSFLVSVGIIEQRRRLLEIIDFERLSALAKK